MQQFLYISMHDLEKILVIIKSEFATQSLLPINIILLFIIF